MLVKPTPLSSDLESRFLNACKELPGEVKPAFHGTNAANLDSIFSLGLVIPGQGNKVKVANGQAHGLGIYTATLDNPMLSWGFARGTSRPMLVCAVLDDAEVLDQSQQLGMLQMTAESHSVRHVGNAMVVFDPQRVAPLFVVTHKPTHDSLFAARRPVRVVQHVMARSIMSGQQLKRPNRKQKVQPNVQSLGAITFLSRRAARKYRGS